MRRAGIGLRLACGLVLVSVGAALAAARAGPACVTALRLDPPRAFVGQQVLYEVRILRRKDVAQLAWDPAPSFPAFRSEWLPGRSGDADVVHDGEGYTLYHERRALFPTRSGVLTVPAAGLRCKHSGGEEIVSIDAGQLVVEPLPESVGETALVGSVEVSLTASPRRVVLGETLRLSVVLHGPANLWDAPTPFAASDFPDAEIFPRPVEMARDAGRRLGLRRYYAYDVVPRRTGTLRVPALQIPWLDPARRTWEVARSEPLEIAVDPAPPRPEQTGSEKTGSETATRAVAPVPPVRETGGGFSRGAAVIAGLAGLAAVGALLALGRRRRAARPGPQALALARAEALIAAGEIDAGCAALARVLRDALGGRIPEARALSSEEIRERGEGDATLTDAAVLLARLERARFDPGPPEIPDPATLRAVLAALPPTPR